ncbi:type I restriction endonuclease subunit R, partial [Micromonospora marina]|uniref:type I restriction endonuclease subunit R n=1 Tax=Micromonospora marina TaxID=307120 RepID=UPI003D742CCC
MADHNEVVFESEICTYLKSHGWLYSANDTGYDRERALFPEDLFGWLEETQQAAYAKALTAAGSQAKFLDVLTTALDKPLEHGGGTLNILRNGVQYIGGGRLKMAQFRPETSLNATTNEQYAAMRVRVMRQVHFSTADRRSIDLVFFVNGLPVATVELKTDFTQSLDEAINQYRKNRHPLTNGRPEPLLSFGHRALVHFAVSNDLAAMTTKLEGEKTHFLPFDMGHESGAGNPPGEGGRSATAYLWERVWEKDAWLNIIGRLMIVETKEEWDVATGTSVRRTSMLFPRFHQWEAVTNIVAAVREEGVGHRYLIEHSAGSGKTNTIAWTAHRLARLHVNDEKVFDSVIVVVDRNVLDGQLQEAIRQIDGSGKIVATISPQDVRKAGAKSKSGLLATTLKNGELIIAVTVQTFQFALDEIRADSSLKGRRFAVIADEAHSSQSGQMSSKLKAVLTAEEVKEIEEGGEVDVEAILASEMTERAESENISWFAFTATPKNKTLELFGRKGSDGKPVEFHLYSMRQAIEEGYILDVLRGYQSYDTALKIAGRAESGDGDEVVEEAAARKGLMRWVKLHPTNISQKVQIIVEHFHTNVAHLLEGKAKAMVVTDSRRAAVKYKKAIDAYIAKRAAKDASYSYRTLVAFSNSVKMAENEEWASDWGPQPSKDDEFTEAKLNPGAGPDLAAAFKGTTYKIMLVANKYQTGFDQPLLSAMYVDKKLSGVTAVQTLSRLNRTHRTAGGEQKRKTFVIDFVNKPEDIRAAFEPYFTNATLETETDPYIVVHLANKLAQAGIYTPEQVREVAGLWVARKGNNALSAAISPAKNDFARRYAAAIEADDKVTLNTLDLFRKDVSTYVRLYDFMSQIVDYGDPYMEMLSIFLRLLEKVIAAPSWAAEVDLSDVVLVGVKHNKAAAVDISLTGDGELKGIGAAGTGTRKEPKYVALQVVIDKMNDLFGAESFSASQVREFVQGL